MDTEEIEQYQNEIIKMVKKCRNIKCLRFILKLLYKMN
jgi:hypothetical protein